MRRRDFLGVLSGAVAVIPLTSSIAQRRPFRIGWLVFGGATLRPIDQSLKDALSERGLVDGRRIELVYRYANGIARDEFHLAAIVQNLKTLALRAHGPPTTP
jgi:putative ABC transport system substrate-binding protein